MSNICSVNFLSYKIIFLVPLLHLGSDGFHVEVVFGAVHHLLHDAVLDVYFGVAAPMTIADYHHLLRVGCRLSGDGCRVVVFHCLPGIKKASC